MPHIVKPFFPNDAQLETFLTKIHQQASQEDEMVQDMMRERSEKGDLQKFDKEAYYADKMVALEQDKCQFMYNVLRSIKAENVVEAGTSFGVSTVYITAAVRDNIDSKGKHKTPSTSTTTPFVIGTEHEPPKLAKAKANLCEALGSETVDKYINLLSGDLRKSLVTEGLIPQQSVQFVLLDIWTPMALPTMKALEGKLAPGCVILADNTIAVANLYEPLFEYFDNNQFRRQTLPFNGGLEYIIYDP